MIPNLETEWNSVVGYLPQPVVLIDCEPLCTPESEWKLWREKNLWPLLGISVAWSLNPQPGHFAGNIKVNFEKKNAFLKLQVSANVKGNMPGIRKHAGDIWWSFLTSENLQHKIFKKYSVLWSYMTCLLSYFRLFSHIYLLTVEGTVRRRRRRKQLLDNLKEFDRTLHIERRSITSHSVETSLCKRLWACRDTDCGMMIMTHNPLSSTLQVGYV